VRTLPDLLADLQIRQHMRAMRKFGGVWIKPSLPQRVVFRLQRL